MHQRLKQRYFRWLMPALVVAAGLVLLQRTAPVLIRPATAIINDWMPWIFFVSVVAAVAGPLVVRLAFAHRVRQARQVGDEAYLRFRMHLVHTAMVAPYMTLPALATGSSGLFQCGIFLAALYAVYYSYPSRERVDFDRRLFRVEARS